MMLERVASLLFLAGALGCSVPENDTSNPTANYLQVSPGIYRGARPDQSAIDRFEKMSFKTILDLEDDDDAIAAETQMATAAGLHEIVASMSGTSAPEGRTVRTALEALADSSNFPIYVHCLKGMDRTGTIVALHRVFNEGWSASDAETEMLDRGFNTLLASLHEYFEERTGLED